MPRRIAVVFLAILVSPFGIKCQTTGSPAALPQFVGDNRGSHDASEWREGKLDSDPLNLQSANSPSASSGPTTPIPRECDMPELLSKGRPVMSKVWKHQRYGVSLAKNEFRTGEKITLYIWLVNTGKAPAGDLNCDPDYFTGHGFDIYDAHGHRVPTRLETMLQDGCKTDPPKYVISTDKVCLQNFARHIPPHTCLNQDEERFQPDITTDLSESYNLPPGKYFVHLDLHVNPGEGVPNDTCKPREVRPFHPKPAADLTFTVVQP
ncbi:MAG: hypothetical protein ABSG60_16205 [Terracidiphilus sp.]|jgi:hypothetical protein